MKKLLGLVILFLALLSCSKHTITIVSFNIRYDTKNDKENWWGNRKEDLVSHIKTLAPDFLGIQEGKHHQVNYIQKHLPNHNFIGNARDDGKQKGEYTGIYYNSLKFELLKTTTFWLSKTPDSISIGWDAALPRIATYGAFKSKRSGREIHVFNTHFDHRGKTARNESAALLIKKIKEYGLENKSIVVMGDLNATPDQQPIKTLNQYLDDGFKTSLKFYGPKGTFNGFKKDEIPQRRIDYIFTKQLDIKTYKHIDTKRPNGLWPSDHNAVRAEIWF